MAGSHDVDLSVGADASPAAQSLESLRNYGEKAQRELSGIFARGIAVGGIIAGIESIIEKAHELHHEAERFGIDAEQLQSIGNAAKEQGLSLESVARAMNRLEIATGAALAGNQQMAAAFGALDISMLDFQNLNPQQKFLALADAVQKAGANTQTYDSVAKVLGSRFGTELIPLLLQGGKAIEDQSRAMGIWGDGTVDNLDRAYQAWIRLYHAIAIGGGYAIDFTLNILASEWAILKGAAIQLADAVVGAFREIDRAMHLDWSGAANEWNKALAQMKADAIATKNEITAAWTPEHKKPASPTGQFDPDLIADASTRESTRAGGASNVGGTSASRSESTIDRAAAKSREYYLESLSDSARVNELQKERNALEDQLNEKRLQGNLTDEEGSGIQDQIDALDHDIDKTLASLNEKRQAALDAADEQQQAEDRALQILQLQISGHGDLVDSLQKGWEFEDKIDDLTDRINEAWSEGDQTLAEQLTHMRDQVQEEEKLTGELEKQKQIQKSIDDAKNAREKQAGRFNESRSTGISKDEQDQLRQEGKSQSEIAALGGMGTGIATLGSAVTYSDPALLMSTDPSTGVVNQDQLTRNRALAERNLLLGLPLPWSSVALMARKEALQRLADHQATLDKETARVSTLQEANQLSLIAQGRSSLVSPQAALRFPEIAGLLTSNPNIFASVTGGANAGSPGWQTFANDVIQQLREMNAKLTVSMPGAKV